MSKIYFEYGEKGGQGKFSEIRRIIDEQLNQDTANKKNKDVQTENGQMDND